MSVSVAPSWGNWYGVVAKCTKLHGRLPVTEDSSQQVYLCILPSIYRKQLNHRIEKDAEGILDDTMDPTKSRVLDQWRSQPGKPTVTGSRTTGNSAKVWGHILNEIAKAREKNVKSEMSYAVGVLEPYLSNVKRSGMMESGGGYHPSTKHQQRFDKTIFKFPCFGVRVFEEWRNRSVGTKQAPSCWYKIPSYARRRIIIW